MLSKPFREDHKIDGIFGEPRSYGFHSGSDWNGTGGGNTDCGYKLYPITKGEIVHSSLSTAGYGNIVVYKIKGVFGERWVRYCHCRELLVRSGLVQPETPISTLGNTGNSTACHLHWDIIRKPLRNWRTYARTQELLNEYFEDPVAFFNKWKDAEDEEDMPKWLTTLLQERGLTIEDEGKIREIFGKAKDFDDKVKELTEQVKSANETLADKSREVSILTDKVTKLENKVLELEEQYNQVRGERDKATWELDKARATIKKLEDEKEELEETPKEVIKVKKPAINVAKKHLKIIAYLVVSGALGYILSIVSKRPEAVYLTPVINYVLYALEQERKKEGFIKALRK